MDFVSPDGAEKVSSYKLNHDTDRKFLRGLGWSEDKGPMRPYLKRLGWTPKIVHGKKKWVWFEGTRAERALYQHLVESFIWSCFPSCSRFCYRLLILPAQRGFFSEIFISARTMPKQLRQRLNISIFSNKPTFEISFKHHADVEG